MVFMKWEDKFSVKIQDIDQQHKKLFDLVNELFDALRVGKGKEVLGRVLDELIQYTVYHFDTEEQLLKSHAYAAYDKHKMAHDSLATRARKLKQSFEDGNHMISMDVMNFLRDWLNVHILEEDMKYARVLTAKRAS